MGRKESFKTKLVLRVEFKMSGDRRGVRLCVGGCVWKINQVARTPRFKEGEKKTQKSKQALNRGAGAARFQVRPWIHNFVASQQSEGQCTQQKTEEP